MSYTTKLLFEWVHINDIDMVIRLKRAFVIIFKIVLHVENIFQVLIPELMQDHRRDRLGSDKETNIYSFENGTMS